MKKLMALMMMILVLGGSPVAVQAAEGTEDITGLVRQYQDNLKELLNGMDESTVEEAFSFIKDKAAEGNLSSDAGLAEAIQESKEKFGVEIREKDVEEVLEVVNTLEEMGFDSEKIIAKAEAMYEEYGADFVDHAEEIVVDAVKDSLGTIIKKAIVEFFRMLGESIKKFFMDLF